MPTWYLPGQNIDPGNVEALKRAGVPGFAAGGIVPGPTGAPMLAVVHGGEEFSGVGRSLGGSTTINVSVHPRPGQDLRPQDVADAINKAVKQGYGITGVNR